MPYYIRVLSTSADCVPLSALNDELKNLNLSATLSGEVGDTRAWEQLVLSHSDGREIALIERNVVEPGSLGSAELSEFSNEVAACKPANAATWLCAYFGGVKSIYAFQLLSGTDHKNGWDILAAIKNRIWSFAPSILQADNEGFSNEDGYHILWQFSESVRGDWCMGVLQGGRWQHFQMDLANRAQREVFFKGRIPDGAKLL
jgi:hypothetical protein